MRGLTVGVVACACACACACGRYGFDDLGASARDAPASDTPAIDAAVDAPPSDLQISLTVDIGYALAVGTLTTIDLRLGTAANGMIAGDITGCPVGLGPETYTFTRASSPSSTYVYVAAWDDEALKRGFVGVLHPLSGGADVLTGDAGWEVCSTGHYPGAAGPVLTGQMVSDLGACNLGSSPSKGWVDAAGKVSPNAIGHLLVGPEQSTGMPLGPVCSELNGVPPTAKWIWFHPTLTDITGFNATGNNDDQGYLLFRHAI